MSKNISSTNMSEDQRTAYRKSYNQELYPGTTMPPNQMINALSSENPTKTIQAKLVTDPNSTVCVDVPSTCEPPWYNPLSPITGRPFCFANFGKSTNGKDECAEAGGETVYFKFDFDTLGHKYDYGSWGYSLSQELTRGDGGKYILHFFLVLLE
jgi:hypothetical protein